MPSYTYRITSDIPWTDVVDTPDTSAAAQKGRELRDAGYFTEREFVQIDANTREYTLDFLATETTTAEESYQYWRQQIIDNMGEGARIDTGFTSAGWSYTP